MTEYSVNPGNEIAGNLGDKLKLMTSGCRLEVRSFGCKRSMTENQRKKMAEAFNADEDSVSGGRQVIDRKLPVVKDLFQAIREAKALWRDHTIKYEDGVRLIRTDRIAWMNQEISILQKKAKHAANEIYVAWDDIKENAKGRLAELYEEDDYDFDVRDAFGMVISYPAIEPDERLKDLAPELYEAEHERIRAQFKEAAIAAEEALQDEFKKLIGGLLAKLQESAEDGKKKVVQQRGIDALVDFATRFDELTISNNESLAAIVTQAKELAGKTSIKDLKDGEKREEFTTSLASVSAALEAFIVAAPVRKFDLE